MGIQDEMAETRPSQAAALKETPLQERLTNQIEAVQDEARASLNAAVAKLLDEIAMLRVRIFGD